MNSQGTESRRAKGCTLWCNQSSGYSGYAGYPCHGDAEALVLGGLAPHTVGHTGAGHCALRATVTSSGDVCPPHRWFFSLMASTFAWLLCEISIILYIFIQHQVDPCVLHMDPSCGGACCCLLVCFPLGFLCVLASLSSRFQLESVFSTLPT